MTTRRFASILLTLSLVGAVSLVAQINPEFRAERDRLFQSSRANRDAAHRSVDEFDENPFKNTKISIQKVAPGGSVSVTVPGNYPPGTVMLSERDGVTLAGATLTRTSYSGRLAIPANEMPGFARLYGFTPLSATQVEQNGFLSVAFIDAVYSLDLTSASGIRVKVTPLEKTFTIDAQQKNAHVRYRAEFFKPGETKPFETMNGTQDFYIGNTAPEHFDISFTESANSPEAAVEELGRQMADPKLTDAQRNALMLKIVEAQQRMMQGLTNPAALQAASQQKADDFGCHDLLVLPGTSGTLGTLQANMRCGKNFEGGQLKVTGTMAIVK